MKLRLVRSSSVAILIVLILAIVAIPSLPKVYAAFPATGVVDYLPITLTNNQAGGFTTSTAVLLNIPWNNYNGYLDPNVDNVGLFDSSGTLLLAWCESNCVNTATSSNVWFLPDPSTTIAGSGGTAIVYLGFYALHTDNYVTHNTAPCDGFRPYAFWDNAPQLSSPYGNTDCTPINQGIFDNYDNFTSDSFIHSWTAVTTPACTGSSGAVQSDGLTLMASGAGCTVHFYNTAFFSDLIELDMYSQNYVSASGSTAVGFAIMKNGALSSSNNTDMGLSNAVVGQWVGGGGTNVPKVGYTNATGYFNAATGSAVTNPLGVMGFSCVQSLGSGCAATSTPTLSFYYDSFNGNLRTQEATATPTLEPGGNTGHPDIFLSTNSSSSITVSFYYYATDPLANINDVMPSTSLGAVVGPPPVGGTTNYCCIVSYPSTTTTVTSTNFLSTGSSTAITNTYTNFFSGSTTSKTTTKTTTTFTRQYPFIDNVMFNVPSSNFSEKFNFIVDNSGSGNATQLLSVSFANTPSDTTLSIPNTELPLNVAQNSEANLPAGLQIAIPGLKTGSYTIRGTATFLKFNGPTFAYVTTPFTVTLNAGTFWTSLFPWILLIIIILTIASAIALLVHHQQNGRSHRYHGFGKWH